MRQMFAKRLSIIVFLVSNIYKGICLYGLTLMVTVSKLASGGIVWFISTAEVGLMASVWFEILLACVCLNWHFRWIWSCVFTFSTSVSRTLSLTGCCYVCTGLGNYLYVDASPKTQGKKARLFSPEVGPNTGPLCLKFSYQLEDEGTLRVLLRNPLREETLLWALQDSQGPTWKEGRTIVPQSPKEFQVNWGDMYKMAKLDRKSTIHSDSNKYIGSE